MAKWSDFPDAAAEANRLRDANAEKDAIIMAQAIDNAELRAEIANLRAINAAQAETIWRYQQDVRTRMARSGE